MLVLLKVLSGQYHSYPLTQIDLNAKCLCKNFIGMILQPIVEVSMGMNHACALMTSGAVVCWGRDHSGSTVDRTGTDWIDVSAGHSLSCGVRSSGTVECWGYRITPSPPGDDFTSVACGEEFCCGLHATASVSCWSTGSVVDTPTGIHDVPNKKTQRRGKALKGW